MAKHLYKYKGILIILLLLPISGLLCQEHPFDAQLITTEDGLANLMTTSICKDKRGFIWAGTAYGLNLYDGYNFKLLTKEENALHANKNISRIEEDGDGKLWLFYNDEFNSFTIEAIDVFDPKTDRAVPFNTFFSGNAPFEAAEICSPKIIDPENRFWISTNKGELFLYKNGNFKKIFQQEDFLSQYITVDEEGKVWLGCKNNLLSLDTLGNILEKIALPGQILGIWRGTDQAIWVSTQNREDKQVRVWHKLKNQLLLPFRFTRNDQTVEAQKEQPFLYLNQKGYWFVKIEDQLHLFNFQGEWLGNYNKLMGENPDLRFLSYFEDGDRLWLASSTGILKISAKRNSFQLIHAKEEVLSDCRSLVEDEQGNVYFLNSAIFKWNPGTQTIRKIANTKGAAYVLTYQDSLLWAGHYHEKRLAFQLDLRTNERKDYLSFHSNKSLIHSLAKTGDPKRYLAGLNRGLAYVDLREEKLLPFESYRANNDKDRLLEQSEVNFIYKNALGFWLATNNGVFLLRKDEGVIRHYDVSSGDLPFNYIRHIYEDKDGAFWLATKGGGVIWWRPPFPSGRNKKTDDSSFIESNSAYKQFTAEDGLSNNFTYAVYGDDYDQLWIPSDKGLMQMDKTSFRVRTFTTDDGLPHNEFNHTAHYQTKDGKLYFGGLGGLISFHPKIFADELMNKSPLVFTEYYLLEAGAEEMTNKTHLLKAPEGIVIKPRDKFLELHFALLDYKNPKQHHYAYQIEGYSNNWNYTDDNFIRITHLPYGVYTLKIQGQSGSNGWSEQELSLIIRVLKPFYLQWRFILSFLIFGAGLIVALTRRRIVALKRNQERLEIEVRKRTRQLEEKNDRIETDRQIIAAQAESLEALDKAKSRFFSNITHEFRTPLTLIIGPLEQTISGLSSRVLIKRMQGVLKNARHILSLVNQLLDLSKIESGRMKVQAARGDIVAYTQELTKRFEPLAHKKGQLLGFVSNQDSWETQFDKDKWDKIVYNLLSNAIKFTPPGENIQLSVMKIYEGEEEWIRLDIKDTGIGIEKKELGSIFNRFYQIDDSSIRTQGGTGVGLALVKELIELQGGQIRVLSEIDKGTSFEVRLPVLQAKEVKPLLDLSTSETLLALEAADKSSGLKNSQSALSKTEKLDLLIVEDNEEIRDYIRYCLDEARYNIIEANDGEEGLQKAQTLIPDLIISDVMMPKKDGFALTQAIRSDLRTSHIPLILLTAKASLESRLEGLQRGADAYLSKPFSPRELALRIEKLIEIRRLLQRRYQNGDPSTEDVVYPQEDEFVIDLRAYILEHIDETNLNGERIGRHFGMSRSHLHRKLKALTNHSVRDFVKSMRLEKALELIREGKSNVSEIAWQTGFSSVSHFSRSFKKVYGKAPSEM